MPPSARRTSDLCPRCRKLVSHNVSRCPHCGLANPSSILARGTASLFSFEADRLLSLMITTNVVLFVISLLLNPGSGMHLHPMSFLSPSNQSLLVMGSTGTIPLFQFHRWWSLISASYLHGSLLHILFNMIALRQLLPLVTREYGVHRTVIIYTLSGIGAYLISALAGIRFTIGASAAVCGLIGALLYYGKSRGGFYGQTLFSQIGGWALSIIVFGFFFPGINNWGHIGGLVMGWLLGTWLGYSDTRKSRKHHHVLGVICIIITAVALGYSIFNAALFLLYRFT